MTQVYEYVIKCLIIVLFLVLSCFLLRVCVMFQNKKRSRFNGNYLIKYILLNFMVFFSIKIISCLEHMQT